MREALLRLESDGLLQIVPKKGAYVRPITEAEVESSRLAASALCRLDHPRSPERHAGEARRRLALAADRERPYGKDRRCPSSLPALEFLFLGGDQGASRGPA